MPAAINELTAAGGNRTAVLPRGNGYVVANKTGTIGAGLALDSLVYAQRVSPTSNLRAFLEQVRLQWTTIVAFTTAITPGRRLGLYRAAGAAATGGTAIAAAAKKDPTGPASQCDAASGGDIRIAAAAALGAAGIVRGELLGVLELVHVGAAGGHHVETFEWAAPKTAPAQLAPGELLVVSNPVAMDAAGTWQLGVTVHWHEAPAYS